MKRHWRVKETNSILGKKRVETGERREASMFERKQYITILLSSTAPVIR